MMTGTFNTPKQKETIRKAINRVSMVTGTTIGLTVSGIGSAYSAETDVVQDSVNGLQEYQIYKHEGTNLTSGKTFAHNISDTGIGVTVVTPEQLNGKNPEEVAQTIQTSVADNYDTVLLVVDSKQDQIYVGSSNDNVKKDLQNMFTKPVDDAGWNLVSQSDNIVNTYALDGGETSSDVYNNALKKQQEEKQAKDNANKSVVQKSVDGLKEYRIYKNDGTNLTDGSAISQKISDTKIGVTVVTPQSVQNKDLHEVANLIHQDVSEQYDTVIVVEDGNKDSFAVSSSVDGIESSFTKELGNQPVDDAGWTLLADSNNLVDTYHNTIASIEQREQEQNEQAISDALGTTAIYAGGLTLTVGALVLLHKIREILNNRKKTIRGRVKNYFKNNTEEFKNTMVTFGELSDLHRQELRGTGFGLYNEIDNLFDKVKDLFSAMEREGTTEANKAKIETEYTHTFNKLNDILGKDNYIYIAKTNDNTYFNKDRKETLHKVKESLAIVERQVVSSIRLINESNEIDFEAKLRSIFNNGRHDFERIFEQKNNDETEKTYTNFLKNYFKNINNNK